MKKYSHYIDGKWVAPSNGTWFDSFNPFTAKPWAQVARGDANDAALAVQAAQRAFESKDWSGLTPTARGHLLRRLGDLALKHADRLAEIETRDNGKLISEMSSQTKYLPEWFYYYAGLVDKIEGSVIPVDKASMFNFTQYEPLGVVSVITTWNSPLLLAAWKLAPALAAGNTVVWKPSEFASVSSCEFVQLFAEAGFPDGVVNLVTGYGPEIGETLVTHPDVAKITFTGGEKSGQRINELAARDFKRVSLELGGKSPNIVFEDADLDRAVMGVVSGILGASGQTCVAGSRLLLHKSIQAEFTEKLVEYASQARIGDPMDASTQIGPVTTKLQHERILNHIETARQEGATCILGGNVPTDAATSEGWFIEPTIFTNVTPAMRLANEEVFGPVLAIMPFEDEEEAIQIANGVPYGLAAGIWTENIARALNCSARIKAGTVWVNTYRVVSFASPFGGYKRSGLGRESGKEMIFEFLQTKSVWIDKGSVVHNPYIIK